MLSRAENETQAEAPVKGTRQAEAPVNSAPVRTPTDERGFGGNGEAVRRIANAGRGRSVSGCNDLRPIAVKEA